MVLFTQLLINKCSHTPSAQASPTPGSVLQLSNLLYFVQIKCYIVGKRHFGRSFSVMINLLILVLKRT